MNYLALQRESWWASSLLQAKVFQWVFVRALCASWLIALAAQVRVPFYPVPMTLEDGAIMLVALWAPWRVAVGAVLLFLGYGVVGLPVLSSGAVGLAMFAGPTAGYLVGFVLMSGCIAGLRACYPTDSFWMRLGFVILGNVLLFVLGVGFLACLVGGAEALRLGFWPFAGTAVLKAVLAALLSGRRSSVVR